MNEENENERLPDQYSKEQIEKGKAGIESTKKILEDLRTNPKYKEFFDRYRSDSVDAFISQYATHKNFMYEHGPVIKKLKMRDAGRYRKEAKKYFVMIQEDKLIRL